MLLYDPTVPSEPTGETEGTETELWTPRTPQDSFGGLFSEAMEANSKGAYTEWSQGLANAQLLNMETMDSFIESAVLRNDEEINLVERLCAAGRMQVDAECNNRIEKLQILAKEREQLENIIKGFDNGETYVARPESMDLREEWQRYLFAVLPEVKDEASKGIAEARVQELIRQSATMQASMQQDMKDGYFRDYGEYKALFLVHDPEKQLNGRKTILAPFFTKEAMGVCLASMQDTRRGNVQALFARLLNTLGGGSYEKQRKLQRGGPFNRRRGAGASQEDDD